MAFPDFYDVLDLPQLCNDPEQIYVAYVKKMEEFAPYATRGNSFVMYSGDLYFHIWYYNIAYLTLSDALHMEHTYRMGVIWRNWERKQRIKSRIVIVVSWLVAIICFFRACWLCDSFLYQSGV